MMFDTIDTVDIEDGWTDSVLLYHEEECNLSIKEINKLLW